MAQLGMDADVVEGLGNQLKTQAGHINDLVNQINHIVGQLQSHWWGPDAQVFVNDWWPKHRAELLAAHGSIDGLGSSAINNAREQRTVSGH